jgi:hypothetical protein
MSGLDAQGVSTDAWYLIEAARSVLRILALPYADHADYDAAWRP